MKYNYCKYCVFSVGIKFHSFGKVVALEILLFVVLILFQGCKQSFSTAEAVFVNRLPQYNKVQLRGTMDTLHYALSDDVYNEVRSFNIFNQNGSTYISFYDQRSQTVSIYNFQSKLCIKKLKLKTCFEGHNLYKTTVYTMSFDSILVNNRKTLYLLDTTGTIKASVDFLENPFLTKAVFENTMLPVSANNKIYAGVRFSGSATDLPIISKWRMLYEFDLQKSEASLNYPLPKVYHKDLYGPDFLDYSFCYNNKGRFVFSFPADTNIYETNLHDIHYAYNARSAFQTSIIEPVQKKDLLGKERSRQYAIRDSYGAIYFDPYHRRYLRHMKHKISQQDFDNNRKKRKESVVILDEYFKIIGEAELSKEFSFGSIFITPYGEMYARTKIEDEYQIHFIRLELVEMNFEKRQLSAK